MPRKEKVVIAILSSVLVLVLLTTCVVTYFLLKKDEGTTPGNDTPTEKPTTTTPETPKENNDTPGEQITSNQFEIDVKNYDVEVNGDEINATLNKNPDFIPVTVKFRSENEILFLADEQNIVADLTDSYLLELVKKGATLADDSSALYDFSKEHFSALNIEDFNYDAKMAASSEKNPIKLSDMAKAKVGYCIEQSIFRALAYAYADNPVKMVVMYPSQGNTKDFGHATVKGMNQTPEEIIRDFIDSGIYSWEIRYFEEIVVEKK